MLKLVEIFMNYTSYSLFVVNNFQTIQQDLMEEEAQVEQHKKLALELNVFSEDYDEWVKKL